MDGIFRMRTRKSMGNLHIRLEGIFDRQGASYLAEALQKEEGQCGRFFIDTEKLSAVEPLGAADLHAWLASRAGLTSRIYYKGRNGQQMAVQGQRVLRSKPAHGCGCSGKCTVCKCAQRRQQRGEGAGTGCCRD